MPTFKFKEGTAQYEFSRPKKLPSYTDRIIYRFDETRQGEGAGSTGNGVAVEAYTSLGIHMSDHLPVLMIARVSRAPSGLHF